MQPTNNKTILYKPLFWSLFGLSFLGLILASRLLHLDYQILFHPNYIPSCNINSNFDCSAVAKSPYAFLWKIPVAALGITGYLGVLIFMLLNRKSEIYGSLLLIYCGFSLVSIYYFMLAKLKLDTLCLFCLYTYLINWSITLILGVFWMFKRKEISFFNGFKQVFKHRSQLAIYLLLPALILGPSACLFDKQEDLEKTTNKQGSEANTSESFKTGSEHSIYANGRFDSEKLVARAGAENGAVTMILYSDYQCPFCAEFEQSVQKVLQDFTNVELIRKEYPLDNTCNTALGERQLHESACQAAYFAKCAGKQGKFWEAAEILHSNYRFLSTSSINNFGEILKLDSKDLQSCMSSDAIKQAIIADIQEGQQDGVSGTPGFMINGRLGSGALPYADLKAMLIKAGAK